MIHLKDFSSFSINESISVVKMSPTSYENETVKKLPYTNYIESNRNAFLKKLVRVAKDLKIDPRWLMHTIFHESRFDPKKTENLSGAVGLLKFFPNVLRNFVDTETGKTIKPNDVLEMTNVEQLDLVYYFYKTWFDRLRLKDPISAGDFAAITFYPDLINKKMDFELPNFLVNKNYDMLKDLADLGKINKEKYYEYVEGILNSDKEQEDTNDDFFGNFSGAFADIYNYFSKDPLEYYEELLHSIEDPSSAGNQLANKNAEIQANDLAVTQKYKEIG